METRELGRNGLVVSALGLGCMGMSEFYGERNDEELLRRFITRSRWESTFWIRLTCMASGITRN